MIGSATRPESVTGFLTCTDGIFGPYRAGERAGGAKCRSPAGGAECRGDVLDGLFLGWAHALPVFPVRGRDLAGRVITKRR
jgi:hypothetical protein